MTCFHARDLPDAGRLNNPNPRITTHQITDRQDLMPWAEAAVSGAAQAWAETWE